MEGKENLVYLDDFMKNLEAAGLDTSKIVVFDSKEDVVTLPKLLKDSEAQLNAYRGIRLTAAKLYDRVLRAYGERYVNIEDLIRIAKNEIIDDELRKEVIKMIHDNFNRLKYEENISKIFLEK